ncbi:MAG TPA: protein-L-isoaspartate O-methyltransferase [Hyphomonadaceae bacterium]|nr:protein-L-isoaspartate O-methyltransferase [Hyphomonadaceae bacterium]
MDLQAARAAMIDSQVRTNDVTDRRLIAAMASVAREAFVPANKAALAYAEISVETGAGRWLMTARDFSKLANAAVIKETDRLLDIAPGGGYSAAVFSKIAASVVALEDEAAAGSVRDNLARAGAANVEVISGSLKAGAPSKAPFDVIFVNGAVEDVPKAWLDQLADGGRLCVVVVEGNVRRARVYTRSGNKTAWLTPFETAVPNLPGFERAEEFRL